MKETGSSQRQLDPTNPGDLRFTKIIRGRIGSEEATGWNDLVKAGIKLALSKGISIQELQQQLTLNIRTEALNDDGYSWEPELKLSIQEFDAAKASEHLYRMAKLLNVEFYVRFIWSESDDSAHPGEVGVVQLRHLRTDRPEILRVIRLPGPVGQ